MYQAVFFDIDNTLLFKQPSISEKVFEIVSAHTPDVEREAVERAYAASELWQGQPHLKAGVICCSRVGREIYSRL